MTSYVSVELRRIVAQRALRLCEYCLIHEDDTELGCQVDHVIAEKHGGHTVAKNLCYACAFCNRAKGSDLGSLSQTTGQLVRFYNPRIDRWSDHFALNGSLIEPRTEIGEVTAKILEINDLDRIMERSVLKAHGRYPSPEAIARISPERNS